MEIVTGLTATVSKLLQFSGLSVKKNVSGTKNMEEKALEVYGKIII